MPFEPPLIGGIMFKRIAAAVAVVLMTLGLVASGSASADVANKGKLKITVMGFNAKGVDSSANRNEEYVRLVNVSPDPINVTGWTLSDSVGNDTDLDAWTDVVSPAVKGILPAGGSIIVYSGSGKDENANNVHAIYRNGGHYLNNGGDVVTVRDNGDVFIDKLAYDDFGINPTP